MKDPKPNEIEEETTKKTTRKMYICKDCRERVLLTKAPQFCPSCGSTNIVRDRERAEAFVQDSLKALNYLIDAMDKKWDEYAKLHAEYEAIMRSLSTSICRGVIKKTEIPKPNKHNLAQYLQEYREKKNQEKEE